VKLFSKSSVSNYNFGDGSTGHYTQVVWASTKKVGCGFVQWATTSGALSKVNSNSPMATFYNHKNEKQTKLFLK